MYMQTIEWPLVFSLYVPIVSVYIHASYYYNHQLCISQIGWSDILALLCYIHVSSSFTFPLPCHNLRIYILQLLIILLSLIFNHGSVLIGTSTSSPFLLLSTQQCFNTIKPQEKAPMVSPEPESTALLQPRCHYRLIPLSEIQANFILSRNKN